MKKLKASFIILSVAALQGCCCGMGALYTAKGWEPSPFSRSSVKTSDEPASDQTVCAMALDGRSKWHDGKSIWVKEANDRNLTLDDCRNLIEQEEKFADKEICKIAVARNGEWESKDQYKWWINQAKRRGYTPDTCAQIFISEESSSRICTFAIRNDEWAIENILFVKEAKRRGLTPAKCKFFL